MATAVVGALASALDMRLLYHGGQGASLMRVYEGTDTRSQDILVGAALAIGMAMWAQHRRAPAAGDQRTRPRPSDPAGPSLGRHGREVPPVPVPTP